MAFKWMRSSSSVPAPRRPPNIVWICADDFTPNACGCYGNTTIRTPHIDRLAAEGIRFDRAYCACPLSTPSRQAFWTGRYPRSIGVTLSPTPLPDDEVTLPALLRPAGYEVAAFGKTHYYAPRTHEFDLCVDIDDYAAWRRGQKRTPVPEQIDVLGPWMPFVSPAAVWLNSACLPYAAVDGEMCGTFLASQAAEYLAHPKSRPFFLYVSFYETHSPFWFPIEFRGRHDPREFSVPLVGPEDERSLPLVFEELTPAEKQGIQAAYATSTEFMDKNVGIVLDAIDRSPAANESIVLFTSDHGYLLGQHGRFEKHCCFEPAVRAALLIRKPGLIGAGRSSEALVELIDILPTLLELGGIERLSNLQGRSLVPLLREQTSGHRDFVVAEYADNAEAMIRTSRWKLIYSAGNRTRRDGYVLDEPLRGPDVRLYDLEKDPDEMENLAQRPEQSELLRQLLRELADHLFRTARKPDLVPRTSDIERVLQYCLLPRDGDRVTYLLERLQRGSR